MSEEPKIYYNATIVLYSPPKNYNEIYGNTNSTDIVDENNWWALSAIGLAIGTAAGNILVCLAICWERRLQNMTNYFLMSLAITDLMVAILVMPLGILTLVRGGQDAEVFRNRKGYFSINVQAIGSANLKLINLVARWPGLTHDATIFNNSRVKQNFDDNLFPNSVLLGDAGYNMRSYLLTPLQEPQMREEQLYNESHIRTRNLIERIFVIWKRRFPVLAYGCRLKIDTILTLIIATAVLYNICRTNNEREPPDPEDLEHFLQIMEEDKVPNIPPLDDGILPLANQVRRTLVDTYFRYIEE